MKRSSGLNSQRQDLSNQIGTASRSDREKRTYLVPVLGHWDLVPISGSRDRRVGLIAGEQRGRTNRVQLRAAGVTGSQVETMLGSEWLQSRFRGVYVVGDAPAGELTRETEALLTCPFGAMLDGASASANWGFVPWRLAAGPVEIAVPGGNQTRYRDIRVHRTTTLDARLDARIHNGLPTVSPARALVAIAGVVTRGSLSGDSTTRSTATSFAWLRCERR